MQNLNVLSPPRWKPMHSGPAGRSSKWTLASWRRIKHPLARSHILSYIQLIFQQAPKGGRSSAPNHPRKVKFCCAQHLFSAACPYDCEAGDSSAELMWTGASAEKRQGAGLGAWGVGFAPTKSDILGIYSLDTMHGLWWFHVFLTPLPMKKKLGSIAYTIFIYYHIYHILSIIPSHSITTITIIISYKKQVWQNFPCGDHHFWWDYWAMSSDLAPPERWLVNQHPMDHHCQGTKREWCCRSGFRRRWVLGVVRDPNMPRIFCFFKKLF